MTHVIPGLVDIEGREVLYVETVKGQGFRQFIDEALTACGDVPMPQSGGVIDEKAHLALGDGSTLLAISYKGDVAGWRRKLATYCRAIARRIPLVWELHGGGGGAVGFGGRGALAEPGGG